MSLTVTVPKEALAPGHIVVLDHQEGLKFDPPCDSLLDARNPCANPAYAIVRFREHGDCRRDGKGILVCKPCLDWISANNDVLCALCDTPLFIVVTVKL